MFIGIDHVQLAAPPNTENIARAFYRDLLGLEEIPKPDNLKKRGGCWFRCGSQEIHIGIQPNFSPAQKAHPGLIVSSIKDVKEKLLTAGYALTDEPPIAGRERFFTSDPFGNRLEFLAFEEEK